MLITFDTLCLTLCIFCSCHLVEKARTLIWSQQRLKVRIASQHHLPYNDTAPRITSSCPPWVALMTWEATLVAVTLPGMVTDLPWEDSTDGAPLIPDQGTFQIHSSSIRMLQYCDSVLAASLAAIRLIHCHRRVSQLVEGPACPPVPPWHRGLKP